MLEKRTNPFLAGLNVPYIRYIKRETAISIVPEYYDVEITPYTRVYTTPLLRQFIFKELSIYARDMLLAIQYFIHSDSDYVIITYNKIVKLHGEYGKRRYDDTIRELIRNSVIDYKNKEMNQFWYNPLFISPKDRTKMYPENCSRAATKYY